MSVAGIEMCHVIFFYSSCFVILNPKRKGGGGKFSVDESLFSRSCLRTCNNCHSKSIIADGSVRYKLWAAGKSAWNAWNVFTQILINYEVCALCKDCDDCSSFL